jgi:threonine dehydrogenase-like Zn-dependent dehydrogenase
VRQVLEKVKTDGLAPTLAAVRNKLEQPLPLGYCHVGVVVAVGDDGHAAFAVGDRVVSNGKHAEMVSVPVNLCARIPDGVSDEAAAFTVIGAIALQGIRLVAPTLGEAVVVTGLGLIGLLTVQLLRAQGCRVLGIDLDPAKLALARRFGAETVDLRAGQDPLAVAATFTRGRGVDAVIITAATRSNEPVHQAAQMCRQRGRIVLVGVVGLELSRADFYEKELSFQVSCSYGPGRYDPRYEEQGLDYPIGFVRWTEQRNFEAVLDLLAAGRLDVAPLVSHRFALAEAERAYAVVGGAEPSLGILLEYPGGEAARLLARTVALGDASRLGAASRHSGREAGIQARAGQVQATSTPTVSFIGAGNYATGVLIQAFKAAGAVLRTVASSGGVSGVHAGRKFGFAQTTTDTEALLTDTGTTALVITTRHDSHARWVRQGLAAGKAVFVEKPLCLTTGGVGGDRGDGGAWRAGVPPLPRPLPREGGGEVGPPLPRPLPREGGGEVGPPLPRPLPREGGGEVGPPLPRPLPREGGGEFGPPLPSPPPRGGREFGSPQPRGRSSCSPPPWRGRAGERGSRGRRRPC